LISAKVHSADCTPPDAGIFVYPSDGESNVPFNAVVQIHVVGDPLPNPNEFRISVQGAPVQEARVKQVLDGGVPYIGSIQLFPCFFCLPSSPPYQASVFRNQTLLSTFTVVGASDFNPPSAPFGADAAVDKFDTHPDGGSDCIKDRVRRVRLSLPDAGKPVVYTLREGAQIISPDEASTVGSFYCTGQPHWQGETLWVVSPGKHTIQIEAIDRAGNKSDAGEVSFNADCAAISPGGGGPPTGGVGAGGGGRPADATTGCSSAGGLTGTLFLIGLGLLVRLRNRGRD
jgi:hypothetical protein